MTDVNAELMGGDAAPPDEDEWVCTLLSEV
jgi:hypothetical protein